jgi:dihydrofolate synthase/folylpolyglutamate synthase
LSGDSGSDYEQTLRRLVVARRFGVVLGLERMRGLLDRLGAPDRRLGRVVHVGGTNGKGSTVAMVSALARAAGARVATYTSPHLSCLRERITFGDRGGDRMIDEAAFCAAAREVTAAGGDELTFFEQVTAIAMVAIAAARVDVTVLEVGLGGRFDATNVVDADVAAVTGVAMDHAAILGDTLDAIAREKAGIFKRGKVAIVGACGEPAAEPVLAALARELCGFVIRASAPYAGPLGLAGDHQRRNAAVAIAAIQALGRPVIADALATVTHAGRLERAGDVLLDGAHNPHGAAALAEYVRASRPVLVIAASADKDVAGIAAALAPAVSAVVATRFQQERAMPPAELAARFHTPHMAPDLPTALALARTLGRDLVVAGSLFVVGEARVLLLGAPADPVPAAEKFAPG